MNGGALIGREVELARIVEVLDRARAGHGRCVFVVGEPGIGKTSLAREALVHARTAGCATLVGRCFEQHAGLPFFAFAELLTEAWHAAPASLCEEAPERWPELGRVIPDLLPAPQLSGEDAQLRIRRNVTGFLRAYAAERPLLLFLDDLHWADSATIDLVLYLGRQIRDAPVLLLGTYRDVDLSPHHPLEETLRELIRERVLDEITLRRLPLEGTAALVPACLGAPMLSAAFVELVHARTEGNPFFVEEILKALVEDGTLFRKTEGWECKALSGMHVPRSLRSVVAQRVRRLPDGTRELLQLASVLGQEFDLDVLLAASDQAEAELLNLLDAAVGARLLEERRGAHTERYAFAHALIAQTLYEELPIHRLRRLHQRAGDALERLHSGRAEDQAELARHFLLAGEAQRAAGHAVRAAEHAAELYAHAEAAHYYQMAVEVVQGLANERRTALLQRKMAAELTELNRPTEALKCYEAALAGYRRIEDAVGQAEVHREIGWLYQAHQTFNMRAAVVHLDAALRLWPPERQDPEFVRLLLDAARARVFSSTPDEAAGLVARGLALAEQLDDQALLARALTEDALVQSELVESSVDVIPELDRAEALAFVADPKLLHRIYWNRGVTRHRAGDLEAARVDYRQGIEAARLVRQPGTAAWQSAVHASMLLFQMGDWAAARAAAHEAHAFDPDQMMHAEVIPWADGEHELAVQLLRANIEDSRRHDQATNLIDSLGTLANILIQLERLTEAESAGREAVHLVRTFGQWGMAGDAFAPAAEALALTGAPDAVELLVEAEQVTQRQAQRVAWPALLRTRGLLALRRGDESAAIDALQASAALARSQGARVQLGRTLAVLAEVVRARGDLAVSRAVEAERVVVVERIGPQVQLLRWAELATTPIAAPRREVVPEGPLAILTRREREVAALVAQGRSDRQIAEELIITEGTAGVHVGHILNKLGFHSRAQVAAWATEHGLMRQVT